MKTIKSGNVEIIKLAGDAVVLTINRGRRSFKFSSLMAFVSDLDDIVKACEEMKKNNK